jgi:hypothetical protein
MVGLDFAPVSRESDQGHPGLIRAAHDFTRRIANHVSQRQSLPSYLARQHVLLHFPFPGIAGNVDSLDFGAELLGHQPGDRQRRSGGGRPVPRDEDLGQGRA